MEKATPRVNSSMLKSFEGEVVRVVGKVVDIKVDYVILQTSDLGQVNVSIPPDFKCHEYVEFIGKVQPDLKIEYRDHLNLPGLVNLETYDKAIRLTHKFTNVF